MDYGLFVTYMDSFSQPPEFLVLCPHFTHDMKKIKSRLLLDFPHGLDGKESSCNLEELGWEDPLEGGMATHSSILAWRTRMDRGAWWATVHGVAKSWT